METHRYKGRDILFCIEKLLNDELFDEVIDKYQ